jgi:chemotaxis protein histidine kinase CheA/ActR/RegA family two-component response regulator
MLPTPDLDPMDLAEAELQRELRSMFEVDTQNYLESYEQLVIALTPARWCDDIQELYRCIHTIKGGAVTVGAEAVLQTAILLEDLLSDLRYLEMAPDLSDGLLTQILGEAGELMAGSLLIQDNTGSASFQSALKRLTQLREQVQTSFLSSIDERLQICQDFANQGFDLVVLDLEMAIEKLSSSTVPLDTVDTAAQTLTTLQQIGADLSMDLGWGQLLNAAQSLLLLSEGEEWQSQWPPLLKLLKESARAGGILPPRAQELPGLEIASLETSSLESLSPEFSSDFWSLAADEPTEDEETATLPHLEPDPFFIGLEAGEGDTLFVPESEDSAPDGFVWDEFEPADHPADEQLAAPESLDVAPPDEVTPDEVTPNEIAPELISPEPETLEVETVMSGNEAEISADQTTATSLDVDFGLDLAEVTHDRNDGSTPLDGGLEWHPEGEAIAANAEEIFLEWTIEPTAEEGLDLTLAGLGDTLNAISANDISANDSGEAKPTDSDELEWIIEPDPTVPAMVSPAPQTPAPTPAKAVPNSNAGVQVSIPLERLDRSAQTLVEVMLSTRRTQGLYQDLQAQLTQIVQLAQDSAIFIADLRKMQDDFALMRNLQNPGDRDGVQVEGYRQGYLMINRLLENSLRLSELGAEASTIAHRTTDSFTQLDVNIQSLQSTVETSRLVPFKTIGFRMKALLRDLVNRFGKPAQLILKGDQLELDAGTVQAIEPALQHLLRNAFDHGLESPEERIVKGKPEQGTLTLSLQRRGSRYQLTLQDDGRGIDRDQIGAIAAQKGLPLHQTQSNAALLAVLCQPGFSSRDTVSEVSGRGVGMDVVATQLQTLGGKLELDTTPNQGTTFTLTVPVPHLLVSCVVVAVSGQRFAIPAESIQSMQLWDLAQPTSQEADSLFPWTVGYQGSDEPLCSLLDYWRGTTSRTAFADTALCLRIKTEAGQNGQKMLWLAVDELVEKLDLLINPIPKPLEVPVGLLGVSALASGQMVPVLEPPAIAQGLLTQASAQTVMLENTPPSPTPNTDPHTSPLEETVASEQPVILVVDDAALLRRRLEVSLVNYGYQVYTCRDGLEAYEWLYSNPAPSLMITDIEMPRMDGFTLIDRCRQEGWTLPILVTSSRLSEEWGKEARRVGASDYLTKGFTTATLIAKVTELIEAASAL